MSICQAIIAYFAVPYWDNHDFIRPRGQVSTVRALCGPEMRPRAENFRFYFALWIRPTGMWIGWAACRIEALNYVDLQ